MKFISLHSKTKKYSRLQQIQPQMRRLTIIPLGLILVRFGMGLAFQPLVTERNRRRSNVHRPSSIGAKDKNDDDGMYLEEVKNPERRNLFLNVATAGVLAVTGASSWYLFNQNMFTPEGFRRFPSTQFIAALGDPNSSSGTGAKEWGVWRKDPGPRGVWLKDYENELESNSNLAPAGWKFDPQDWWLEEHGLIMEAPQFPIPAGRYLVTGGRRVTTGLTILDDGSWKLDEGSLFDVTHLPCRSARYKPVADGTGSPKNARPSDFPVKPGAVMPSVPGTNSEDYAVLFLLGKAG